MIGLIFMMFVSVCLLAGNIGIVTESDRYKFHFEPLMYVFVVAQGYRFLTALKRTA